MKINPTGENILGIQQRSLIGAVILLTSILGFAARVMADPNDPYCVSDWTDWELDDAPSLTITCASIADKCGFGAVSASATVTKTDGEKIRVDNNDCEDPNYQTATVTLSPTTTWTASGCGASPASGSGATASFSVSSCGTCTVTFNTTATTTDPDGTYSDSCSKSFKVGNATISGGATSAQINRCQDPNRTVTFTTPCSATWTITPTGGTTGDATISGGVVTLGTKPGTYTITATSTDNTACTDSKSLTVTLDCDCTHHTLNPALTWAPGALPCPDALGNGWNAAPFTSTCGNTAQLKCIACGNSHCVYFYLNGGNVGHCPYLGSSWTAKYAVCNCQAVIMKTYWDVYETDPPLIGPGVNAGYNITWTCAGGLGAPFCYKADGTARTCNGGDW